MADPKDNDSKPVETTPEAPKPGETNTAASRSAAVRPPVLDMKAKDKTAGARPAEGPAKPDDQPAAENAADKLAGKSTSKGETAHIAAEAVTAPKARSAGAGIGAALGGGVLGVDRRRDLLLYFRLSGLRQ